jgi:hypothetical protein
MKILLLSTAVLLTACALNEDFDVSGNTSYTSSSASRVERLKHDLNVGYRKTVYMDEVNDRLFFVGGNAEVEHFNLGQDYQVNGYFITGMEF